MGIFPLFDFLASVFCFYVNLPEVFQSLRQAVASPLYRQGAEFGSPVSVPLRKLRSSFLQVPPNRLMRCFATSIVASSWGSRFSAVIWVIVMLIPIRRTTAEYLW